MHLRIWLSLFIAGLVFSGITAFSLEQELSTLLLGLDRLGVPRGSALMTWLHTVHDALVTTNRHYPFLAYGTDWLAFGHLAIAVAFLGLWIDPVRNKWLITWGLITCSAVVPVAFAAGAIRSVPLYWRFIDSSFGVFGAIPLLFCRYYVIRLEQHKPARRILTRLA
jgi:hypothetical protein